MEHFLTWFLSALGGAFVGSFVAGYFRKKGENLATHEDLNKLVKQIEATTQATKTIEARISDQMWDRQRQWEMKRDAVFSVMQALDDADGTLMQIGSRYEAEDIFSSGTAEDWAEAQIELSKIWRAAVTAFEKKRFVASLICSDEFEEMLREVSSNIGKCETAIEERKVDGYTAIAIPVQLSIALAKNAARKELGLASSATPQSTESSAAQGPVH